MSTAAQSRPLSDEEYARLTPDQLQRGGLADPTEGAPADFGGRVFPNPNHIRPQLDTDNPVPVTRLPHGVSFNRQNFTGNATEHLAVPTAADVAPESGRVIGADFSPKPQAAAKSTSDDWQDFKSSQQASGGDWQDLSAETKTTTPGKTEEPGFLDRDIPLSGSLLNPTLSGVQSVGRGLRSAVSGLGHTIAHPIDTAEGMVHSVADIPHQIGEVPGAIRDINASADPLGHYARAAQDTAGDAAGQALVALGTEGLGKGVAAGARPVLRAARPVVGAVARGAADVIDPDLTGILSPRLAHIQRIAGKVGNALAEKPAYPGAPLPAAPGTELGQARALTLGGRAAQEPAAALGRVRVAGPVPVAAGPVAGPAAAAAPAASSVASGPAIASPGASVASAPRIASDIGQWQPPPELGAFSDQADVGAKARASNPEPAGRGGGVERRAVDRTGQEAGDKLFSQARKELGDDASSDAITARIDELKTPEAAAPKPAPAVAVPKSTVAPKTTSAALGQQLNDALGGRPLKPGVSLRNQAAPTAGASDLTSQIQQSLDKANTGKVPADSTPKPGTIGDLPTQIKKSLQKAEPLPEGFTRVDSSLLKGYKYDPAAKRFSAILNNGESYVHGEVSPEQFKAFENADSQGSAWTKNIRQGPGTVQVQHNGVSTKPGILTTEAGGTMPKSRAGMAEGKLIESLKDALTKKMKAKSGD